MRAIRICHFRISDVIYAIVILVCGVQPRAHAQAKQEPIAFEVATIKPVAEYGKGFGPHIGPARASYISLPLQSLIAFAYNIGSFQISGPKWIFTNLYDIEATFPEGTSPEKEREMLQSLLRDRFQLHFHVEQREEKGYALVVGKDGAKLKKSTSSASEDSTPLRPGEEIVGQGNDKHRELFTFDYKANMMHRENSKMSMEDLAKFVTAVLHNTGEKDIVVDRTGLKGDYQVAFDSPVGATVPSDDSSSMSASDPVGSVTVTKSLDKLGLKLIKQKAQVDYYVIDHVEKPSEN